MIPTPMVVLRECRKCGQRGPLTGFYKHPYCRFGRLWACIPCVRKRAKATKPKYSESASCRASAKKYNESEKGRAAKKRYLETEKGRKNTKAAKENYRRSERGKATAKAASQRFEQTPKRKEYLKKYRASDVRKASVKRYTSSEKGKATLRKSVHARRGWMIPKDFTQSDICEYCGCSDISMQTDHIIPVSFKDFVPEEVRADTRFFATACQSCNVSKHARLPLSEKHLDQVSDALGYDIRKADWRPDFWQPPV